MPRRKAQAPKPEEQKKEEAAPQPRRVTAFDFKYKVTEPPKNG